MKFDEFKVLVKAMKAVYTSPNFLPDADSVRVWYKLLADIPYERLATAIQKYMLTAKFPPTVAELREVAAGLDRAPTSWADGWGQVRRAIRNFGYYNREEALASMDSVTRRVVHRLGWQELCMSETPMQDRANFRMAYEQEEKQANDAAVLPPEFRKRIEQLQRSAIAEMGGGYEQQG